MDGPSRLRYWAAALVVLGGAILLALAIPNGHRFVRAETIAGPHPDCIGSGPCFVDVVDHRLAIRLGLIAIAFLVMGTLFVIHQVGQRRGSDVVAI